MAPDDSIKLNTSPDFKLAAGMSFSLALCVGGKLLAVYINRTN